MVAVPVLVMVIHAEADSAVRYGVLVGVVGAAVVLPLSTTMISSAHATD